MQAISQGGSEHVINADACIVRAGRTQENSMPDQTQAMMSQRGRLRARYDNFIGGKWQTPAKGRYFVDSSPIDGMKLCDVARSDAEDVERALDAAHAARDGWGRTAPAERGRSFLRRNSPMNSTAPDNRSTSADISSSCRMASDTGNRRSPATACAHTFRSMTMTIW